MIDQAINEADLATSHPDFTTATVTVQPMDSVQNTLLMTWQQRVHPPDVRTAFAAIDRVLASTDQPVYVVVDLLHDPQFPLSETMFTAVSSYSHPLLAAWLIVGGNRGARAIESFLARLTRRRNVFWFDSVAEALDYRASLSEGD